MGGNAVLEIATMHGQGAAALSSSSFPIPSGGTDLFQGCSELLLNASSFVTSPSSLRRQRVHLCKGT